MLYSDLIYFSVSAYCYTLPQIKQQITGNHIRDCLSKLASVVSLLLLFPFTTLMAPSRIVVCQEADLAAVAKAPLGYTVLSHHSFTCFLPF